MRLHLRSRLRASSHWSCTKQGLLTSPSHRIEFKSLKLYLKLIEIAEKEEADEFIIGLPRSFDGRETPQSNKVRAIAGRFAVQAAERGWRVYLQDEHGTSTEAVERMINLGVRKSVQQGSIDAYAATGYQKDLKWIHIVPMKDMRMMARILMQINLTIF